MAGRKPTARKTSNRTGKKDAAQQEQGQIVELPVRGASISVTGGSTPLPISEYRFLQLNEGDYKPTDSASRKLIRSHVMRNYFQEKKIQSEDTSLANSASTVNSKDKLKGRWRLGTQVLSVAQVREKGAEDTERSQQDLLASTALDEVHQQPLPLELVSHSARTSATLNGALRDRAPHMEFFQANVRDPFDSMPVATSNPRTNRLMYFYSKEFHINLHAQNPSRKFFGYVIGNEGLLHSMLAIVALYMHSHKGVPVKAEILHHRGQAMQVIQRGMSAAETTDFMALGSSMAGMAVFENLCGNYFTAKAHLKALRALIKAAGGVKYFAKNDSIPRAFAWAEYHYAGATRTIPAFRYSATECFHPEPPLPEQLLFDAAKDYPYGLALIDTYGHSVYSIFRRLHLISLATNPEWKDAWNTEADFRYALSNVMLDAEYDLLVLAYQMKSKMSSIAGSELDLVGVCDGLCTAAQIYFYAGLRIMPLGARIVDIYLLRLRLVLHSKTLTEDWCAHASPESLLWTLAIVATSAHGRAEFLPAMNQLRKLCGKLEIVDIEGMVVMLKGFAWNHIIDGLGRSALKDLFRRASRPLDVRDDRNNFAQLPEAQPPGNGSYIGFL